MRPLSLFKPDTHQLHWVSISVLLLLFLTGFSLTVVRALDEAGLIIVLILLGWASNGLFMPIWEFRSKHPEKTSWFCWGLVAFYLILGFVCFKAPALLLKYSYWVFVCYLGVWLFSILVLLHRMYTSKHWLAQIGLMGLIIIKVTGFIYFVYLFITPYSSV